MALADGSLWSLLLAPFDVAETKTAGKSPPCCSHIADGPGAMAFLQVLVDLVEEGGGREPRLIGADEQRQILGHEAGFDGVDADLFERAANFASSALSSSLAR